MQGGDRRARYQQGPQAVHATIDEATLAALSEEDRAAVLAAMSGTEAPTPPAGDAAAAPAAGAQEEMPKFDCHSSMDQLQVCQAP